MNFKFDKSTFSTFFILILISLFVNIYTFTSLAPLYKYLVSGELFTDFDRVFTHEDYLFLMRFLMYFLSGSLTAIIIYVSYMELLFLRVKQLNRFFIIWSIVALLVFVAYLFHLNFLEIPNDYITYNHYKFNRAMWYIGRGLNFGVIAIYIANFKYSKQIEEEKQRQIHSLKIENLKYQFYILKNQLNPRFLFNSIETLNQLIKQKPKSAQSFVLELSKLLRYSISEIEINNIEKEIEIAKSYAFIMKYKYGKRLQVDFGIDMENINLQLPSFSVQIALEQIISICEKGDNKFRISISLTPDDCILVSCNTQSTFPIYETNNVAIKNLSKQYEFFMGEPIQINTNNNGLEIKLPSLNKWHE